MIPLPLMLMLWFLVLFLWFCCGALAVRMLYAFDGYQLPDSVAFWYALFTGVLGLIAIVLIWGCRCIYRFFKDKQFILIIGGFINGR